MDQHLPEFQICLLRLPSGHNSNINRGNPPMPTIDIYFSCVRMYRRSGDGMMTKKLLTRRNLLKYAIFAGLLLFVPILALIRRFTISRQRYDCKPVDQISERIPIPEGVQGQLGFKATVSHDGRMIAIAGNPVTDGNLFGKNKIGTVPDGEYMLMYALRSQFYVAEAPFTNFRFLWKNRNTSFASSIAISPSNDRLAALVYEYPLEHLDSYEEAVELIRNDETKRLQYVEQIKKIFGQGYEANLYLIDTNTGNCEKLANMFTGRLPSDNFTRLVNERALTWNVAGNLLFSHDYDHVFSVDMSGQRKNIFPLKNCGVFSSLFCDSEDNLSMVIIEKGGGEYKSYDGPSSLIQIDLKGNVLKKENFHCPPGYYFEENNITFVGKDKLLYFTISEEDARLNEIPRTSEVPLERSASKRKSAVFYDPNDVQFYYTVCGILPDTNEILFAKKRLVGGTPYSEANKAVPWVELRRFSLNSM